MKKEQVRKHLSNVAGMPIEIVAINENKFSIYYDGKSKEAEERLKKAFGHAASWYKDPVYDSALDKSFIYGELTLN